jgi:hypothetical protein
MMANHYRIKIKQITILTCSLINKLISKMIYINLLMNSKMLVRQQSKRIAIWINQWTIIIYKIIFIFINNQTKLMKQ